MFNFNEYIINEYLENTFKDVNSKINFLKWFGNSKVVDDNNKPLIVYHGTKFKFSKFRKSAIGQTDNGYYGKGFYFTKNIDTAKEYGSVIVPVYLRIEKPFILLSASGNDHDSIYDVRDSLSTLKGMPKNLKTIRTLPEGYYIQVEEKESRYRRNEKYKVYTVFPEEKYYGTDKEIYGEECFSELSAIIKFNDQLNNVNYDAGWVTDLLKMLNRDNFHIILKNNGYDGLFVVDAEHNNEVLEYVVYEPNQIKSISNNIFSDSSDINI
jgi:hypothetical protein